MAVVSLSLCLSILLIWVTYVQSNQLPKLKYFQARGAAELARILLKVGQMQFEDIRYNIAVKPEGGFDVPEFTAAKEAGEFRVNMDRLPILQLENGVEIGQSRAIERYVSSHCGLMGNNAEESALIDCIAENIRDIKDKWGKIRMTGGFGQNEEKDKLIAQWFDGELCTWLEKLEKSLPQAAPGQWCAVGNKLSYADVSIWHLLRDHFPPNHKAEVRTAETKANCIRLSKIADKVAEIVDLKTYLEQRPNTLF
jgi:glutathione S-transferase